MGKPLHKLSVLSCLLVLATLLHNISATKFIVTNNAKNTPGGARFDREIGAGYTLQMMEIILPFVWRVFEERTDSERKYVPVLNLYISDFPPPAMAYTNGDNINFSVTGIQRFPPKQARHWFISTMYREMTHIYQWSGQRTAPRGLIEGFADYVMVKSMMYDYMTYPKRGSGSGSRWDEGYGITERFLEYGDSLRPGFAVALNKKMRYAYSDHYFVELLGKPVDQLWREYKAKYRQ